MPRKSKKKSTNIDTTNNGGDNEQQQQLPEDFTVASAVSNGSTFLSLDDGYGFNNNNEHDDELLENNGAGKNNKFTIDDASESNRLQNLMDAIHDLINVSSERRASKRDQCFRRAFKALTCFATSEQGREHIHANIKDITSSCLWAIRAGAGKAAEQYAACRCLEATSILLGGDYCDDEFCESIETVLVRTIKVSGRDPQVRSAALRTLAMSNFVCSSNSNSNTDDNAHQVMDLCEAACQEEWRDNPTPQLLRVTALEAWALLATTVLDDSEMANNVGRGVHMLPMLQTSLEIGNNSELRAAAGECVALIHESRLNLRGVNSDATDAITCMMNNSERRYRRGSWDGSEWEVLMDELKQRVAELAVESGHHMSKKAKKQQKATFREILATVVDDEAPSHVVSFRSGGADLVLTSWREIIQLNFVRHCLQGGFQVQLLMNPMLHVIFGVVDGGSALREAAGLSQLEKRLFMSKTSDASKAKDKFMTKRRASRNNQKNLFLTADE